MGEIIDKVKEKAKDVKDAVVNTAKALHSINILTQKFALELNTTLVMENAGLSARMPGLKRSAYPRPSNKCSTTFKKA